MTKSLNLLYPPLLNSPKFEKKTETVDAGFNAPTLLLVMMRINCPTSLVLRRKTDETVNP